MDNIESTFRFSLVDPIITISSPILFFKPEDAANKIHERAVRLQ